MKKIIFNLGKCLPKADQKKINGGFDDGPNGVPIGVCYSYRIGIYRIRCNELCDDGTDPICAHF